MPRPARYQYLYLLISAFGVGSPLAPAQQPNGVVMNAAEREFAAAMSGATLVGTFTVDGGAPSDDVTLRPERYELGEVSKLANGQWRMPTRIKYGDKDITVPVMVPVEWVGAEGPEPTPVVVVDNLFFPGAGTYSARVLFHEGTYAGRWSGATHGGVLFGKIVPAGRADRKAEPTD